MNRIIKFRAWDDVEKKMYSATDIFNPVNGCWYEDDQDGSLSINKILDSYGIRRKLISMQFTALKDKNGKEICEGDILRARHQLGFDGIGRCEFVNGCFEFVAIDKEKMRKSYGGAKDIRISDFIGDKTRVDIEVVGNIFENPELCAK